MKRSRLEAASDTYLPGFPESAQANGRWNLSPTVVAIQQQAPVALAKEKGINIRGQFVERPPQSLQHAGFPPIAPEYLPTIKINEMAGICTNQNIHRIEVLVKHPVVMKQSDGATDPLPVALGKLALLQDRREGITLLDFFGNKEPRGKPRGI